MLLGPLGAGGGGRVHKALDLVGRRLVAVKAIPVHNQQKRRQLVAELKALRSTSTSQETHVIQILDCYAHAPSDAAWWWSNTLMAGRTLSKEVVLPMKAQLSREAGRYRFEARAWQELRS